MSKAKITKDVSDMYKLFREIGELEVLFTDMTGDYKKDIEKFAQQYSGVAQTAKQDYRNGE